MWTANVEHIKPESRVDTIKDTVHGRPNMGNEQKSATVTKSTLRSPSQIQTTACSDCWAALSIPLCCYLWVLGRVEYTPRVLLPVGTGQRWVHPVCCYPWILGRNGWKRHRCVVALLWPLQTRICSWCPQLRHKEPSLVKFVSSKFYFQSTLEGWMMKVPPRDMYTLVHVRFYRSFTTNRTSRGLSLFAAASAQLRRLDHNPL